MQDFKKYTVPTNLWEQLFPQIPTNLSEQYTWCSNRKKHVKGGGLPYWCSNRKKYTLREEVYYIGVPIEKKHVKGGGLL